MKMLWILECIFHSDFDHRKYSGAAGWKEETRYTIAVAGTGYVGLSIATLLSQHHKVYAVDIVQAKIDMVNQRKSPIQDEYIEKYLAEKDLDLTATLDAEMAYSAADFVVIVAPTNVYSTNRIGVASSRRTCFAHYMGCWNWSYFTATWAINTGCLYKTLNFWPLRHKIGTTFSEVMRKWWKTGKNNKNLWAYH